MDRHTWICTHETHETHNMGLAAGRADLHPSVDHADPQIRFAWIHMDRHLGLEAGRRSANPSARGVLGDSLRAFGLNPALWRLTALSAISPSAPTTAAPGAGQRDETGCSRPRQAVSGPMSSGPFSGERIAAQGPGRTRPTSNVDQVSRGDVKPRHLIAPSIPRSAHTLRQACSTPARQVVGPILGWSGQASASIAAKPIADSKRVQ
jgi:hypothetical protein